jgi:hypothetical protein
MEFLVFYRTLATSTQMSGNLGGLNGSTQHSGRTQFALKTKAKSLAKVRSAGTLPWLGFDRVQTDRFSRGSIVESTPWMVLHRPVELARITGNLGTGTGLSGLRLRGTDSD